MAISSRSKYGGTLAIVTATGVLIAVTGVSILAITMLLGGSRELTNANAAGTLNIAHKAPQATSVELTADHKHFQSAYEKINLSNCNEMLSEAMLIAMNASAMQESQEATRNAEEVIAEADAICGLLSKKLNDPKEIEQHFMQVAQSNNLRMCGEQAKVAVEPGWSTSYLDRGGPSNVRIDAADYPEGFDRQQFEQTALVPGTPYLQGYKELRFPGISKPLHLVSLEPGSQPHLISAAAFEQSADKGTLGWSNGVPNAFKAVSSTIDTATKARLISRSFSVAAAAGVPIRPQIRQGFIKIVNDGGFNQCIAKNMHAAEYVNHQVVLGRAGTGCGGSGRKDCADGIPMNPSVFADYEGTFGAGIPLLQDDWSWKVIPSPMQLSNGVHDFSLNQKWEQKLNSFKEQMKADVWVQIGGKARAGDVCSYLFQIKHMALGDYPIPERIITSPGGIQAIMAAAMAGQTINPSAAMLQGPAPPVFTFTSQRTGEVCSWARDAMAMMQKDPGGQIMYRPEPGWVWHAGDGSEMQLGAAITSHAGEGSNWDPSTALSSNGPSNSASVTLKSTSDSGRQFSGIMSLPASRSGQNSHNNPIRFTRPATLSDILHANGSNSHPQELQSVRDQLVQRIHQFAPDLNSAQLDSLFSSCEVPLGATAYIYQAKNGQVVMRLESDSRIGNEAPWLVRSMGVSADGKAQQHYGNWRALLNVLVNVNGDWGDKRSGQSNPARAPFGKFNESATTGYKGIFSQDLITFVPASGAHKLLAEVKLQAFVCGGTQSAPAADPLSAMLTGNAATLSQPQ